MNTVRPTFSLPLLAVLVATCTTACGDAGSKTDSAGNAAAGAQPALESAEKKIIPGREGFESRSNAVTPLFVALKEGNNEAVALLLEDGANPNETPFADGLMPLHVAAGMGSLENAQALLDMDANVNAIQSAGASALNIAVSVGNVEMAELLLKKGADANLGDKLGFSPMHNLVAATGKTMLLTPDQAVNLVDSLLAAGADVDASTTEGDTPLAWACEFGAIELVKLFIEKGADVNATGAQNFTALHRATLAQHIDLVTLLIEAGADVNAKATDENATALRMAATLENEPLAKLLSGAGGE